MNERSAAARRAGTAPAARPHDEPARRATAVVGLERVPGGVAGGGRRAGAGALRRPDVARTRPELAARLAAVRDSGRTLVLVPTMGALHAGHRALLRRARELGDTVAVSIFVNPLQFSPTEDLDRYPRTFDADLEMCAAEGVSLIFAPPSDEMYGQPPQITVHPGPLGDELEGASRPGHFAGVLTVVAKLFGLLRPDVAVFGDKDYQQLTLILRMVADLDLGVHVVGVPTVREPDGLALSSRNRYLSTGERTAATAIPAALQAGVGAAGDGAAAVLAAGRAVLTAEPVIQLDYLALRGPDLGPAPSTGDARLLVAARVGPARLIDNVPLVLGPDRQPAPGRDTAGRLGDPVRT